MKEQSKKAFLLLGDETACFVPVNLWGDAANLGIDIGDRIQLKAPIVSNQGGDPCVTRLAQYQCFEKEEKPFGNYRNVGWNLNIGTLDNWKESIITILGSPLQITNMGKNVIGEEGRLKLALDIEDTKRGKIKVMAFGEVGERILGIKTTELKAMIDADDPNLKSLFVDVMGKKLKAIHDSETEKRKRKRISANYCSSNTGDISTQE